MLLALGLPLVAIELMGLRFRGVLVGGLAISAHGLGPGLTGSGGEPASGRQGSAESV
jgi:hypothetical protein